MRRIYSSNTANAPRLDTDRLFMDPENRYEFRSVTKWALDYATRAQLTRRDLWARFARVFREDADMPDAGWRCEYWGKMMRGACFVYECTRDPELYQCLADTVSDIMTAQDGLGRVSTYSREGEMDGWDLWGRKYVLLGMQYFLEICGDAELRARIVDSMIRQTDAIMRVIGEGKKPITAATRHWRGLNSSSILEPVVRLYSITGEKRFLDFAEYIVRIGGTDVENLFRLAYEDQLCPYQYPVTKAYEMTSCFEGLLEYYRVTRDPRDRQAVIRFADRVLETDFTVIGGCGCTHELFDHSTVRQANTTNGRIAQETCVTVTLMKFFCQLTLLTGDPKYADAVETSFYNAYLGAFNTMGVIEPTIARDHPDWILEPLPFDSYSPLAAGTRGNGVGGLKRMADRHYYGCCACIGAAGVGTAAKMALLSAEDGFALSLYLDGRARTVSPAGNPVTFDIRTAYPADGDVSVTLSLRTPERFRLCLRVPAWSERTEIFVNGESVAPQTGYTALDRVWKDGDCVRLRLDMRTRMIRPKGYGHDILMNRVIWDAQYVVPVYDVEDPLAKNHAALLRGPIVLAQENRLGYSVDDPVEIAADPDGFVNVRRSNAAPYPHMVEVAVPLADGRLMPVTDYASAGKTWTEESRMAAWILTKQELTK